LLFPAYITGIPVEPELEWHIQDLAGHSGVLLHTGQLGDVSNHVGVTQLVTRGLGQLVPDVEPVTVVFVDTLTTDFDLNVLHQDVTQPVQPTESSAGGHSHAGKSHTQVHAVNQITITRDGAGYFLAEVGRAIEGLFNGLHGEVCLVSLTFL